MYNNSSPNYDDWCFNKQYQYDLLKEFEENPIDIMENFEPRRIRNIIMAFFGFVSLFYIGITYCIYGKLQRAKRSENILSLLIFIGDFFIIFVNAGLKVHIKQIPCYIILLFNSIGYPLAFVGVLGKIFLLYIKFLNSLKKERINNVERFNGLYYKTDLNYINSKVIKDNNSISTSFTSIPNDLPFMKYITSTNVVVTVIVTVIITVVYSAIAQNYSKFFKLNGEIGYCNQGEWEFIPLYVILYISLILAFGMFIRMLHYKNKRFRLSKYVYIKIIIGILLVSFYIDFTYTTSLTYHIWFIDPELIFCVFIVYCHTILIGIPAYKMLNVKYMKKNLNKSLDSLLFVIERPELCREFSKFCTLEFCIENLLFHNRVKQFKKEIEDYEKENEKSIKKMKLLENTFEEGDIDIIDDYYRGTPERNTIKASNSNNNHKIEYNEYVPEILYHDVIEIYKKFISHDSIYEVNIPNRIYQDIKNELNNSQRQIKKTIFDRADMEVLNNLYNDTYQKFLKYQKEIKNINVLEVYTDNRRHTLGVGEQI